MYAKMTMEKDVNKLVEWYENFTGSEDKFQKTPGSPSTTISKIELEELKDIDKYRSLVRQLMWYTTKVGPDVANTPRDFSVHISNPGPEYYKALERLIGYLKLKKIKWIIIRKPIVLKSFFFIPIMPWIRKQERVSVV